MNYKIKNKEEIDNWFNTKRLQGIDVISIKGNPPEGATYEDGDKVIGKINVAWFDPVNNDTIDLIYEL